MKKAFALPLCLMILPLFAQNVRTPSGTVRRFENFKSKFVDARTIDVWLPENYSPQKKYAVLYMHDGQMLFDSANTWTQTEWGVDETLTQLMTDKKIRECIVVGIWNNGRKRHAEYFPQKALVYLPEYGKQQLMPLLAEGPMGDNYLKFLVTELKPFIDSTFSTLKDQQNTFIAGSSMGGLISLYAICEYPNVFYGAACLSTHWTGTYTADNNPIPDAILQYMKNHLPAPSNHKIYFDHGTATLDSLYAPFQIKADEIMKQKGYTSANWMSKVYPGENHTETAWRKRFAVPAEFLLKK